QTPNCRPPSPHSSRCSLTGPDFQRAAKKPITVTSAKKKTKIQSATQSIAAMTLLPALLLGLVRRSAAIDQPDQQRGDRYPGELVPIEEGKAEQRGLQEIVERHPQQADKRDQQKSPHGRAPVLADVARPALFLGNVFGTGMLLSNRIYGCCSALLQQLIRRGPPSPERTSFAIASRGNPRRLQDAIGLYLRSRDEDRAPVLTNEDRQACRQPLEFERNPAVAR